MGTYIKKYELDYAYKLYFIFKSLPKIVLKNLKSQIEVNLIELSTVIKGIEPDQNTHFICEGGWYFNKPSKLIDILPKYKIYYFILSPTINQLKKQYLFRTPKSRKDVNNDNDWINYKRSIWDPQLKANDRNKVILKDLNMGYFEFTDESVDVKTDKIIKIIKQQKDPTIFVITGPNASGKSTLLYSLLKRFNLLDD